MPRNDDVPQRATPLACCLLAAALTCAGAARAEEERLDPVSEKIAPTAFSNEKPQPQLSWGTGDGKSYWVPAIDIVAFDMLLNLFNRTFIDEDVYGSDLDSVRDHFSGKWVWDNDPFNVNQFLHPYQGSMYHGFARSAGLDYGAAQAYTLLGSVFWEITGETDPPSINDQITTGFAGSFFGEALFRMASLALESGDGPPNIWRELGAAALSPSTGFNRWAYGDRFDGVFRSNDPAVYTRVQLGAVLNATVDSNVNLNRSDDPEQPAIPQEFQRGEADLDFTISYGLPGKPGYRYDRPFDYFKFEFTAVTSNVLENVSSQGLLYGSDYAIGDDYRGIWGLYGTYDYIAPQIFRVSTTAVGLGTTGQWWLSRRTALQGSVIGAVGYGSGGVTEGHGERDYHNGVTPQGLVGLRLILGDNAMLELNGREYYISDLASDEKGGSENLARLEAALTVRVYDLHGLTVRYFVTDRNAHYQDIPDTQQTVGAVSVAYTYLGHKWFGAVDWRPEALSK